MRSLGGMEESSGEAGELAWPWVMWLLWLLLDSGDPIMVEVSGCRVSITLTRGGEGKERCDAWRGGDSELVGEGELCWWSRTRLY